MEAEFRKLSLKKGDRSRKQTSLKKNGAPHWRDIAPMTRSARQKMYAQAPWCFLDISDPEHPKYPICPEGSINPTSQGLDAAVRRARMLGKQSIIHKGQELQMKYGFPVTSGGTITRSNKMKVENVGVKKENINKEKNTVKKETTTKRESHNRINTERLSISRSRNSRSKTPKKLAKSKNESPRSIIKKEGSVKKESHININTTKNKTKRIPKRQTRNMEMPPLEAL